jgi:hypothetical protein
MFLLPYLTRINSVLHALERIIIDPPKKEMSE